MELEKLINEVSGSTFGWNDELARLIRNNNSYINLTFTGLFTDASPFLQVKLTDRQVKRAFRKNNNIKWQFHH